MSFKMLCSSTPIPAPLYLTPQKKYMYSKVQALLAKLSIKKPNMLKFEAENDSYYVLIDTSPFKPNEQIFSLTSGEYVYHPEYGELKYLGQEYPPSINKNQIANSKKFWFVEHCKDSKPIALKENELKELLSLRNLKQPIKIKLKTNHYATLDISEEALDKFGMKPFQKFTMDDENNKKLKNCIAVGTAVDGTFWYTNENKKGIFCLDNFKSNKNFAKIGISYKKLFLNEDERTSLLNQYVVHDYEEPDFLKDEPQNIVYAILNKDHKVLTEHLKDEISKKINSLVLPGLQWWTCIHFAIFTQDLSIINLVLPYLNENGLKFCQISQKKLVKHIIDLPNNNRTLTLLRTLLSNKPGLLASQIFNLDETRNELKTKMGSILHKNEPQGNETFVSNGKRFSNK